jgi:hypothetical protein
VITAGNGLRLLGARTLAHGRYPGSSARQVAVPPGRDWGLVRPHRATASELAETTQSAAATAWEETAVVRAKRRVFPGRREQVAHARQFVARALAGCSVTGEAILCVSELATNALLHTASGNEGEFEVIVQRVGRGSALLSLMRGRPQLRPRAHSTRPPKTAGDWAWWR